MSASSLLTTEVSAFVLETIRSAGLVLATPILFSAAPARLRGATVVLLTLVSHGAAARASGAIDSLERVAVAAPTELLLGLAMGLVVRFSLSTVEVMGDAISPLLGVGSASLFDPHTQTEETSFTRIFRLFAMLLALLLGVHRVFIAILIRSFQVIPVGSLVEPSLSAPDLVRISSDCIAAGIRLALPILAVLLLVQLALAFLSRAAPALQLFSVGFALSLVSGMLVVFISLPEFAREFERELSHTGERIELVVSHMSGG